MDVNEGEVASEDEDGHDGADVDNAAAVQAVAEQLEKQQDGDNLELDDDVDDDDDDDDDEGGGQRGRWRLQL